MVADPVEPDEEEAEGERQKAWTGGEQGGRQPQHGVGLRDIGHRHVQHEQRDGDRKDPVAEGHEAADAVGTLPIGLDRRALLVLDGQLALAHTSDPMRSASPTSGLEERIAESDDGIGHLANASTMPGYRGLGCQTALIERRLQDAAAAGCSRASVVAMWDSQSHRNLARAGFRTVYTKAVWRFGE